MKTNAFHNLLIPVIGVLVSACSSSPRVATPEDVPDVVLSRTDDLSSRPDWIRESEPFVIENGVVSSLGQATMPGSDRVEAGLRIAENNAKAAIATAIEQKLEFIFQNAEEGTKMDATQARYIGAEASNLVSSSIRPSKRYWEKIATTSDTGERLTRYRIFARVTMPEDDFKRSILTAVRKQEGNGGISPEFAKKVDQQWDRFVGGDQTPRGTASSPTTNR